SGVTYTNSSAYPLLEEVTMTFTTSGNMQFSLVSTVGGAAGPPQTPVFPGAGTGSASIAFMVPSGSTFSATVSESGSGQPLAISGWHENQFRGGGGVIGVSF